MHISRLLQISGACVISGLYCEGALVLANVGDCQAVYHGQVKSAIGAPVTAQTVGAFPFRQGYGDVNKRYKYQHEREYHRRLACVVCVSNDGRLWCKKFT